MRAMRIHRYGDASVIRDDDVPRPAPGPGDVLVKVAATSFNPSDLGFRRGLIGSGLPLTLGLEVAGTVAGTGAGVRGLTPGDRVIGRAAGAAADYVTVPAARLVAAPTTIPLAHAAALPVAGLTAWQAVFEHAKVTAGRRVLVNGAGGAVGGFAVQLARHAGAHVTATASPRSAAVVRRLGAHRVIDYTVTPVAGLREPVDVVLHLVASPAPAVPGALIVSITVPVDPGVRFVARDDPGQLAELVALVDAGTVQVDVAGTRHLTDLPEVHRDAEAGRLRGKTVIVP